MSPEIDQPREIPLDSPEHWTVAGRRAYEPKPVIELMTDLTLESLSPAHLCISCGAPTQVEIVDDYLREGVSLRVEGFAPGYGCTNCPVKTMDRQISVGFQKAAQNLFREAGDLEMVDRIESGLNPTEWWRENKNRFQITEI